MDSIYRPFFENKEIIEGLKDYINKVQKYKNNICDSGVTMDEAYESLELLKNASDEQKAEISQLQGMSYNDLLLHLKYIIFFIDYYVPLNEAIMYLGMCDIYELIANNDVDDLPIVELPDWSQVFISLCKIPSHIINYYITQLDCNNIQKTNLLRAITKKESVSFRECVSQMGNESYFLARIAYQFDYLLNPGDISIFTRAKSPQEKLMMNYLISGMAKQSTEAEQTIRKNTELWRLKKENPDISLPEIGSMISYDEYKAVYFNYMNEYLSNQNIYIGNRHRYSKEIQEIVDPYNVEPEKIDFYNELLKRGCTFDISRKESTFDDLVIFDSISDSEHFDYFSLLTSKITSRGDDTFKEFVNFIAKSGYIENTPEVKQLFTYRLTGKCRPTTEKLPKIHWNGGSKRRAHELIYIIRYSTPHVHDKYKLMEEFFEGPIFRRSSSSYANQANSDFKKGLKRLYPDVFKD